MNNFFTIVGASHWVMLFVYIVSWFVAAFDSDLCVGPGAASPRYHESCPAPSCGAHKETQARDHLGKRILLDLGKLRHVPALEKRIQQAWRMGVSRVESSRRHGRQSKPCDMANERQRLSSSYGLEWIKCDTWLEAITSGLV